MFEKNLKIYLFLFVFLFLVILVPWIILFSSYESRHETLIAKKHLNKEDGIVNFGLFNKEEKYKKELYKLIQPKLTIIGSSRTNQIKRKFFFDHFYNLSRGLNFIPSNIINEFNFLVEKNKNLEVVIWGVDYWDFNSLRCKNQYYKDRQAINIENNTIFESKIIQKQTLEVWKFIIQGKINFKIFFSNLFSPENKYGLNALYSNKGGYLNDGSYFYKEFRNKKFRDEQFKKDSKTNIPYQLSNSAQQEICEMFIKKIIIIKDFLKKNNINLIIFFPPYPELHKESVKNRTDFYQKILLNLKNKDIEYIDLFNHNWGNVDNEFIDWLHPSETISARILFDIAEKYPQINKYLNLKKMDKTIQKCAGRHYCN